MVDIHQTAAAFLRQLERGNPTYREEKIETVPLATPAFVVLRQPSTPPYFHGFKPSGRPVFTYDLRIAKSFTSGCDTIREHVDRLAVIGIEVEPYPTVWNEGRNENEQF